VIGTTQPENTFYNTCRWTAPELLEMDLALSTPASDTYSFAMVAIQIFSGQVPFLEAKSDRTVVAKVLRGARPAKPQDAHRHGLTAAVWAWLEHCWQEDPFSRPSMSLVKDGLKSARENHAHPAQAASIPEFRPHALHQAAKFGSESWALEKRPRRSTYGGTSSMGRNQSASIHSFE
jgi:hypothetical protein